MSKGFTNIYIFYNMEYYFEIRLKFQLKRQELNNNHNIILLIIKKSNDEKSDC